MYGSIPATVFRDGTPQQLSDEQEGLKREIYERMESGAVLRRLRKGARPHLGGVACKAQHAPF